jgi:integrase
MAMMIECPGMVIKCPGPEVKVKTEKRCRGRNLLGSKTCYQCGHSLEGGIEIRCHERNPIGSKTCRHCGRSLKRGGGMVYWIEWRDHGRKKRKRIGPSKEAAELCLGEIRRALVEERYIDRDKGARMSLGELVSWYLTLPEVEAKKSWRRDVTLLRSVTRLLGEKTLIKDLNKGMMDGYVTERLKEDSPARKGERIRPATVNKERMAINAALNRGVAHSKLDVNPLAGKMKKLNEDNIRERVLTGEEFERLLACLSSPLREMALVAFYICMRQGEILELTWDKVDLERNFIRLAGTDTKNGSKRRIPIHPRVREMLINLPRGLHTNRVFLSKGKPVNNYAGNYQLQWSRAVQEGELGDFTFQDLRHCAINNLRLSGNDHFTIMAISGQKTTSVFQRYNVVTEEELQGVKWKTDESSGVHIGVHQPRKTSEFG